MSPHPRAHPVARETPAPRTPPTAQPGGTHDLLVYDGACALCRSSVRLLRGGPRPLQAVAFQQLGPAELDALGLSEAQVRAEAWWVQGPGDLQGGARAVSASLQAAGGWRAVVGRLVDARLARPLASLTYRAVARHRHLLGRRRPTMV